MGCQGPKAQPRIEGQGTEFIGWDACPAWAGQLGDVAPLRNHGRMLISSPAVSILRIFGAHWHLYRDTPASVAPISRDSEATHAIALPD